MNNNNTIEIGATYSYTNNKGFTSKFVVTRYNDKSVFVKTEIGHEYRMSHSSFSKYKKQTK